MTRDELKPYRRPRQRQQTVMVRVTQTYVDRVLWPQFCELSKLLHDYLNEATHDIITSGIHSNLAEADEQKQLPMG